MADDKVTPEIDYTSHNEKTTALHQDHEPELADSDGRRHSVALNIVHNPLKVRIRRRPSSRRALALIGFFFAACYSRTSRQRCQELCNECWDARERRSVRTSRSCSTRS